MRDEGLRDGGMRDGETPAGAPPEGQVRGDLLRDAPRDAPRTGPAKAAPAKPKARANPAMDILRRIENSGWYPLLNLRARLEKAGATTDAQIADRMLDELLAIPVPADTRARMREFLAEERRQLGVDDGRLLATGGQAERVLRRMAHLILSLPEAQLG
jgi:hypothetical protein